MRTRFLVSMVIEDRYRLSETAKDFSQSLEPGTLMTFMDALSDPHCCYEEGGEGTMFLWGLIGNVDVSKFIKDAQKFWDNLFNNKALVENSHILVLWQSTKDDGAYSANIYQLRDGYVNTAIEKLPLDLVIFERD